MPATLTLTREQTLIRHLTDTINSAPLREEFGTVSGELISALAHTACESSDNFSEARQRAFGHISVAKSMAEHINVSYSRKARWQDVLTLMLGTPDYLEVVDSLTVDGEVIVELVAAIYGGGS